MFFDYVNSKVIPFRAFITNIAENVNPIYTDTRYIGRVDRNVVYTGVLRKVSFTLKVFAFSGGEMDRIWTKINYLTGLCFPAMYDSFGFAVPPLVKLTIGDVYRDQPGYIESITHQIEDGTSWELQNGHQAPQGVTMQINFSIMEKTQLNAANIFSAISDLSVANDANMFYPVGVTRSGPHTINNNDGSNTVLAVSDPLSNPTDTMSPGFPQPASAENIGLPSSDLSGLLGG